jgi:glycosyltransferase involved in cell wall biosynthesis
VHLALRLGPTALFGRLIGRAPDVILASSPQLPAAFICLWIARLMGIPFVLEVRDLWPQVLIDHGGKSPKSPMVRVLRWMECQLYRNANVVVVLAQGAEKYVRQRGACFTSWLPNGPDLELFVPQPLPPDRSTFTVLYAGAHGFLNDLENVIEAARLLEHSNSCIRFEFIGDGPEKKALIQSGKGLKSLVFNDPVSKNDIPACMARADAILLSLRDIPLFRYGVSPNKLYDAYAIGRPVITTVPGSINKEVEIHKLGVTAEPGSPSSLADAIHRLAQTPRKEREAMASRATELAQSTYSRQRINAEYNSLLLAVIK